MMPLRMAYWTNSAVFCSPRASRMRALWTSAVPQLRSGLDAVERRHGDVGDDDVRLEFFRGSQKLSAVGHHADDFEFGFEQSAHSLGENPVVIGDQDACSGHGSPPARGTRTSTVVPRPTAEVMENLPRIRLTRSAMLDRPSPG